MNPGVPLRTDFDIVVAGAGPAGTSLAIALGAAGRARVALVEAAPVSSAPSAHDERGIALSLASCRIFERLGIWREVAGSANPIRHIHVSDQGHFGCVRLDAAAHGLEAFGHVVVARVLGEALAHVLARTGGVESLRPVRVLSARRDTDSMILGVQDEVGAREIRCRLLVVADGSRSRLREVLGIGARGRDYHQSVLVATVTPNRHHRDTAYERFGKEGPMALLPLRDGRCVAVLGIPGAERLSGADQDDEAFLERLSARFGRRLGGFISTGPRVRHDLVLSRADRQVQERVVLLGNAAHTIHPNGAQGFNLALRDIAGLAEILDAALEAGTDPGERGCLENYLRSRSADQSRVIGFSDGLADWFYNDRCDRVAIRHAGMMLVDLVPPARDLLVRHGAGLLGRQPAWVRGAPA